MAKKITELGKEMRPVTEFAFPLLSILGEEDYRKIVDARDVFAKKHYTQDYTWVPEPEVEEEDLVPGLKLEAVIWNPANPQAIINGQLVEINDSINEVKVVKIKKESVVVMKEDKEYSLKFMETVFCLSPIGGQGQ